MVIVLDFRAELRSVPFFPCDGLEYLSGLNLDIVTKLSQRDDLSTSEEDKEDEEEEEEEDI